VIIARSPLRVSLGGGGTDLPSYYQDYEGFLIAAAIDKYAYVSVSRPFFQGINLKYSRIENVTHVDQIQHPIIREVLRTLNLKSPQIEISSFADIPSGTGLGSSGSFTTALIKGLYSHYKKQMHPSQIAELACEIEMTKLGEPIGKQDQYIASYGGISEFLFHKDGSVSSSPLNLEMRTIHDLEDNLLLFFTGISRSASEILNDQNSKSSKKDKMMIDNLHFTKELGLKSKEALLANDTDKFAELMHEHWEHKKSRSLGMSNEFIDNAYNQAILAGAIGGKLVGAGGGGYLMFYSNDKEKLRHKMSELGLEEVRFHFDFEGTKVILS
jgi:D-glycero-alpha-D-manno-heptose-7-phosphate kinase